MSDEVAVELRRPAIATIERDAFDVAGPLTAGHAGGQIRRLGIAGGECAERAQLTQAARIAVMKVLAERAVDSSGDTAKVVFRRGSFDIEHVVGNLAAGVAGEHRPRRRG